MQPAGAECRRLFLQQSYLTVIDIPKKTHKLFLIYLASTYFSPFKHDRMTRATFSPLLGFKQHTCRPKFEPTKSDCPMRTLGSGKALIQLEECRQACF